jgi:hypothetical protein
MPSNALAGLESEWIRWVDTEARSRLLNSMFVIDIHQTIYHGQSQSRPGCDEVKAQLIFPSVGSLWSAPTAEEWQSRKYPLGLVNNAAKPLPVVLSDLLAGNFFTSDFFAEFVIISALASQLPAHDHTAWSDIHSNNTQPELDNLKRLFPNSLISQTYIAISYTPLYDLLAVAGDTWVFGHKATPPPAFHTSQAQIGSWSSSLAAAYATHHACKILSLALSQPEGTSRFLSDYWGLYVASLICWAFGHSYPSIDRRPFRPKINSPLAINNILNTDDSNVQPTDDIRLQALAYAHGMLEFKVESLLNNKAGLKEGSLCVIEAVRALLEKDEVGNRCGLLTDTVGVLKNIRVAQWKQFSSGKKELLRPKTAEVYQGK